MPQPKQIEAEVEKIEPKKPKKPDSLEVWDLWSWDEEFGWEFGETYFSRDEAEKACASPLDRIVHFTLE